MVVFFPQLLYFSRFRSICAVLPIERSGFGQAAKGQDFYNPLLESSGLL